MQKLWMRWEKRMREIVREECEAMGLRQPHQEQYGPTVSF